MNKHVKNFTTFLNEDIDSLNRDFFNTSYVSEIAKKIGYEVLYYLESGTRGVAYVLKDNKVLKITTDITEFLVANKLKGKKLIRISNVYDTYKIKNQEIYLIILEYLDSLPDDLVDLIEDFNINKRNNSEFEEFDKELKEIEYELRENGVTNPIDYTWWMNMGIKNGKLAVFDVGDKTIQYDEYSEIELDS